MEKADKILTKMDKNIDKLKTKKQSPFQKIPENIKPENTQKNASAVPDVKKLSNSGPPPNMMKSSEAIPS